MATEQVLALEKRVTEFTDMYKSTEFPPELFGEILKLTDEDALELASRLFMKSEWRNIWTS
jgi:hypothetical protein